MVKIKYLTITIVATFLAFVQKQTERLDVIVLSQSQIIIRIRQRF